ncbi:hypothetical protein fHeYen902_092c [Yersinia phage fHe-Yen9-02]|nr:hypothetical protein fHeYen902_092c [Yersinia phage fHe-Yen9-02]
MSVDTIVLIVLLICAVIYWIQRIRENKDKKKN